MGVRAENELAELIELSARVGSQSLLVQGSTGNTSIKIGSTLWIKASGKWLANAKREWMFIPVSLTDAERFLSSPLDASHGVKDGRGLTPSIETAMHLALPHLVVIHLHSVNTIAWAVQSDGASHLHELLNGICWSWIDYAPSGAPLARAIQASLGTSPSNVFVLANHGLVIAAQTCGEGLAFLRAIEKRVDIEPRAASNANGAILERLSRSTDYRPADSEVAHSLGTDSVSADLVAGGILYPCQAMFLGRSSFILSPGCSVGELRSAFIEQNGFRPPAILVRGAGVLVAKDLTPVEAETLMGLAQVVRRLAANARIQYLSRRRVDEVLRTNLYNRAQPRPSVKYATAAARSKSASY